ncbi:MAG: NUDIX hydrolase [Gemmatimonadetes bacterium]|nr:NUDIX hydrolase [Gemmatimonadota bacterium]
MAREEIYDGRIVRLSRDSVRFPDGEVGVLELIRHPGAAAVVPFLDSPLEPNPRIVLVYQYRYAAGGLIYEVPAGIPRTPRESWEECAARELAEETGFQADDLRYLSRILTTPGFTDEVIHLFAATGLQEVGTQRDPDEFLEVVTLRFSKVLHMVEAGEIVDGKSVAGLLFAASFLSSVWPEKRRPPPR